MHFRLLLLLLEGSKGNKSRGLWQKQQKLQNGETRFLLFGQTFSVIVWRIAACIGEQAKATNEWRNQPINIEQKSNIRRIN